MTKVGTFDIKAYEKRRRKRSTARLDLFGKCNTELLALNTSDQYLRLVHEDDIIMTAVLLRRIRERLFAVTELALMAITTLPKEKQ
jgi:hypothetical protein